jgi:hypothetical protein
MQDHDIYLLDEYLLDIYMWIYLIRFNICLLKKIKLVFIFNIYR